MMTEMDILTGGPEFAGRYSSRDEMERDAPREYGRVAMTDHATFCYDGKEWIIAKMDQFIDFKVLSRHYIIGRGYVTVVYNPDLLPIDRHRSAICQGQFRLPIRGIECWKTLMTIPRTKPEWGLVTSEETIGDWLRIRMYPGKEE